MKKISKRTKVLALIIIIICFSKPYDDKRIKCTRDNSIRNVVKKRCVYDCPHYKRKLFYKEDTQ